MNMAQSIEDLFSEQSKKLELLRIATTLIQNKANLSNELSAVHTEVCSMKHDLQIAREGLDSMKQKNEAMKDLSKLLNKLRERISDMENNLPSKLLHDYAKMQTNEVKKSAAKSKSQTRNYKSSESNLSDNVFEEDKESRVENCKKTLFNEPEIFPTIKLLTQDEFELIPKYMIGRQSLEAVNNFITAINDTLRAKYSLMALGKNGARKKGEFNLYMFYKKQENLDDKEKGKVYFFTAADYHRQTKSKLDKTKLNLLTVLRHCKRLREIRAAEAIQYAVFIASS